MTLFDGFDLQLADKDKSSEELIEEALTTLTDVLDYIASERSEGDNLYIELSEVEEKLVKALEQCRKEV